MNDKLSDLLPEQTATVAAIYEYHKAKGDAEPRRGYLGASIIGKECDRELWFTFRQCAEGEDFDGRMYRLFETGDLAEHRFTAELRAIGCEVHEVDPTTGEQFEVKAIGGHFSGHMDGAAVGIPEAPATWHVLEYKTHGNKSFSKLKVHGVQASKPQHYGQMMVYMHLTGLRRALYLAVNKNTDELYSERIRYDAKVAGLIMERAERIITAAQPPPPITDNPDDWRCRFCSAATICRGSNTRAVPLPAITCRSCVHATPETDTEHGRWSCARHGCSLTDEHQQRACPDHLLIPGLVGFAEPVDSGCDAEGHDWIEYANTVGGVRWANGRGPGHFSSLELTKLPSLLISADGGVGQAKAVFEGVVRAVYPNLLAMYEDAEQLWEGDGADLIAGWADVFDGEDMAELTPTATSEENGVLAAEYGDRIACIHVESDSAIILRGKA